MWNNGKLGEGIHKPVQSCLAMGIILEIYSLNGYYDSFREKEDDLHCALSAFIKMVKFNIIRFMTWEACLRSEKKQQKRQVTLQQSCLNLKNTYFEASKTSK